MAEEQHTNEEHSQVITLQDKLPRHFERFKRYSLASVVFNFIG